MRRGHLLLPFALLLAPGPVRADEIPILVRRPPADVQDDAVKAAYERLRAQPPAPRPERVQELREETRFSTIERIEAVMDGGVLVSRRLEPGAEEALVLMGVQRAPNRLEVGHHKVFEGRYYRMLAIAAGVIPGAPDALQLELAIGREASLETVTRSDGRILLVALRRGP